MFLNESTVRSVLAEMLIVYFCIKQKGVSNSIAIDCWVLMPEHKGGAHEKYIRRGKKIKKEEMLFCMRKMG